MPQFRRRNTLIYRIIISAMAWLSLTMACDVRDALYSTCALSVENLTGLRIEALAIRSDTSEEWSENLLAEPLEIGASVTLGQFDKGIYEMQVVGNDLSSDFVFSIDLSFAESILLEIKVSEAV